MEHPLRRPRLALLAVLALAAPGRAAPDRIPVKDAIAQLERMRQPLIDNMIANMGLRAQRDPEVAKLLKDGQLQASAKFFVGHVHDEVVAKIRAGAAGDQISALEVDHYTKSFKDELFAIRDTMQKETANGDSFNQMQPRDKWQKILADTKESRSNIVRDNSDPKDTVPGPVPLTDKTLVEVYGNLGAGGVPKQPGNVAPAPNNPVATPPAPPTDGGTAPSPVSGGTGATPNPGSPNSGATPNTPSPVTAPPPEPGAPAPGSASESAGAHLALGDLTGAKQDLDHAAKDGSADANAYALRGQLALDDGRYSAAYNDAKQALSMDAKNQAALALLHFSQGRSDGAPPDQSGAAAGPAPGAAGAAADGGSSSGGSSSAGIGGVSGSIAAANAVPSSSALSRLSGDQARTAAQGALGMNDLAGARAYVDRALAQDPGNPALLNLRAMISARGRDFSRAEADAKAGLAIAPKDPALLRTLGYAQVRNKDYRDAVASANSMMERDPNDAYAYALRAHAYGSMGDRDAMMADLKRAAELDPRFRDAAAKMEGQLQLPNDADILFLFPGEDASGATAAAPAAPAAPAGRNLGLLAAASLGGGLLLAFGMKDRIAAWFAHLTRTGPTVTDAPPDDEDQPLPPV